jgi:ribosomal protein S1
VERFTRADQDRLVEGVVTDVVPFGVVVDLGADHRGFIDPLYIDDDDHYRVGERVANHLIIFDTRKRCYLLRPPHQIPVIERLRRRGHDVADPDWPE